VTHNAQILLLAWGPKCPTPAKSSGLPGLLWAGKSVVEFDRREVASWACQAIAVTNH